MNRGRLQNRLLAWLMALMIGVMIGAPNVVSIVVPNGVMIGATPFAWLSSPATAQEVSPAGTDSTALVDEIDAPPPLDTDSCLALTAQAFAEVPWLVYFDAPDSLFSLLDRWAAPCGPAEPILRTALLAAIWEGSFNEGMYDAGILDHLLWYREKRQRIHVEPYLNPRSPFFGVASPVDGAPGIASYDSFTTGLADQMLPHTGSGSLAEALCLFYATGDANIFTRLRRQGLPDTHLQAYYDEEVDALRLRAGARWGVYAGVWNPQDELRRLGAHPYVGGIFGWRGNRWIARLAAEVRFLDAAEYYYVDTGEEIVETKDFASAFAGLEAGLRVARLGPVTLDGYLSGGIEGIHYLPGSEDWLNSPQFGVGLGSRYHLRDRYGSYFGIDVGLQRTWYQSRGYGSDLHGYAWSVRFIYGQTINPRAARRLTALDQPPAGS